MSDMSDWPNESKPAESNPPPFDLPFEDDLVEDVPTSEAPWPRAPLPKADEEKLEERRRQLSALQAGEFVALRQRQAEERAALGLQDDAEPEPIKTFAPVNINVQLDELMQYFGMEFDEDGPTGNPNRDIRQQIMEMAADKLVKKVLSDGPLFKERLNSAINADLGAILDDELQKLYQPVDWSGQPKGEPTTLSQMVGEQAKTYMAEAMSEPSKFDSNRGGHRGKLKKFIDEEVGRQFEGELKKTVIPAKEAVLEAVRKRGAEFMTQAFADAAYKVNATTQGPVMNTGQ